jgi:serine-type D-Ala-D-Ala carboxypeptidase (penicillin-binding protein 5/6)
MNKILPNFTISKSDGKKIKLAAIALILILASILFLMAGPRALDLVESKVVSENLPPEVLPSDGTVLSQTVQAPKTQVISAGLPVPGLSAVAAIAMDTDLNKILFEKNIHARMSPASTTKIMTAIISSEYFNSGDLLTVPPQAIVGGSSMGLSAGEQLTFRSLLYGMLLNSGNDAAFTLAYNYPGGFDSFISRMNAKALEIGAKDSHFDNPAGFDSPTHYTSAYDLLLIGKEALKNAKLGTVYSTKETSVTSVDKIHIHALKNLNKLLDSEGFLGMKTGTTELAGESLVGLIERDNRTILTVMLNSQDRFGETKSLLDWVFKNYSWKVN